MTWKQRTFEKHIRGEPLTPLEKWYGERMAVKGRKEIRAMSDTGYQSKEDPPWPTMFRRAGKTGPTYSMWRRWMLDRHPHLDLPTWEELKNGELPETP